MHTSTDTNTLTHRCADTNHLLFDILCVPNPNRHNRKRNQDAHACDEDAVLHQDCVHPKWCNLKSHHYTTTKSPSNWRRHVLSIDQTDRPPEGNRMYERSLPDGIFESALVVHQLRNVTIHPLGLDAVLLRNLRANECYHCRVR